MTTIGNITGSPFGDTLFGIFGGQPLVPFEGELRQSRLDSLGNQRQDYRLHQLQVQQEKDGRRLSEQARGWAQPTPPKPIDAWAYVLKIRYPARLAFSAYAHEIERSASVILYARRIETQNQCDPLVRRSRLLREAQELLGAMFDQDCPLAQRIRGELRRSATPLMFGLGHDNRLANAARRY